MTKPTRSCNGCAIATALPHVDQRFFLPAYLDSSGWRPVDLDRDDVGWDEVAELVDASYRMVADKRQLAALDVRGDLRAGDDPGR